MYAENYCTSWLRFFFVSSNISGQEECRTSRNALGDYSDPYGVTLCPKFGSVEKHGGKIWVRGRKRLQPLPQTFALQGLSHQTHLMLLDELAQIDEGVAHASQ